MKPLLRHRQPAQLLAWQALLLVMVLLPVMGLAVDGGLLFTAHRRLQMEADGAARVGAAQLDEAAAQDADVVALNPTAAEAAARGYFDNLPGVTVDARADTRSIRVQAQRALPLPLGLFVGQRSITITATAVAAPCSGVASAEGPC